MRFNLCTLLFISDDGMFGEIKRKMDGNIAMTIFGSMLKGITRRYTEARF